MRSVCGLGPAVLAAGLVLGCGGAFAASAEKGKAAFIQHGCWQCHGTEGQGGQAGARLAPDPVLSNDDLADIHAYLEAIPKRADYKDIPLLNQ